MTKLTVLRNQSESSRFHRLNVDDSRTAIAAKGSGELEASLKQLLDGEVRFDKGTRALYATDGSNYRQAPIGVVIPRHVQDVELTMRIAREHGAPVLSRGGGTSLAGQCCNVAVVMDFSKYMHHVVKIDAANKLGHVQPGCVLDHFRETAKKQAGLFFGPDPATHSRCTIGGMLGNNSCGSHSLLSKKYGLGVRMSDNTHALDVLLYDGTRMHVGPTPPEKLDALIGGGGRQGEIYAALKALVDRYGNAIREKFPKLERRVSGYNLNDLLPENGFNVARALVGSESTLITVLEATLHLVPAPKARSVVMLGFEDIYTAAECALEVLPFQPTACEGIDELLFEYVKKKGDESAALAILPKGPAFLLVEFGGESKKDSDDQANRMIAHVKGLGQRAPVDHKLYDNPEQEKMIWDVREGALGSTAWIPGHPDTWPGFEDSAVPVENVAPYLRELRPLFRKYGYNPSLYGHMGQGCIHCRVGFDLYTQPGIETYKKFMHEAVDLVVKFGGVASGEHGDGQARAEFLPKMFGDELFGAFKQFKRIWDPANRMNTGKVINLEGPAYTITENMRIGKDYNPPQPETYFSYPADRHSFARAALRCVGVGACRREGGGTMCPSYMVTREEKDSTRGRARMLFEMMNGEVIDDGWKSEEVKDSLDLCFSCKGCKGDCPVNVDMTTYKGEFLSHYYQGKLRPRHMYAFGWIHIWSKLASFAPSMANLFTQMPGLSAIAKLIAGVHPKRVIPAFAPRSFKQWFRSHEPKNPGGTPMVLFADTFNDHFHPDVAIAAVEVLEDAGFFVHVPMADVCCGRPLYDYGFLGMAKRWWVQMLDALRPYYVAGMPMVVLEPSCWASFKDELGNLMPNSEDAKRLADLTFTLADFLRKKAPDYRLPALKRNAMVHGHCHQKALDALNDKEFGKLFAEKEIFDKMGLSHKHPDAGCCGMAGAFGYEKINDHYEVGVAAGERMLLPEVRNAPDDELIIADGFSCQEQIIQQTDRTPLHTAQVLQMALHGDVPRDHPEASIIDARKKAIHVGMARAAATLGVAVAAGLFVMHVRKKSKTRSQLMR
ncbi:MAG TPA: FAD-binding and (Fe-S)-binding domain-containing protein [Tepidisphaeraceae bacterium]|jgi:FAD/FMN-containing dehydrogenase/Fe-S oxidoreductase|nr:FAD-binding and (Fe-S)-binding domain-containing protein [Tepidisphaeraceae bacterium]